MWERKYSFFSFLFSPARLMSHSRPASTPWPWAPQPGPSASTSSTSCPSGSRIGDSAYSAGTRAPTRTRTSWWRARSQACLWGGRSQGRSFWPGSSRRSCWESTRGAGILKRSAHGNCFLQLFFNQHISQHWNVAILICSLQFFLLLILTSLFLCYLAICKQNSRDYSQRNLALLAGHARVLVIETALV